MNKFEITYRNLLSSHFLYTFIIIYITFEMLDQTKNILFVILFNDVSSTDGLDKKVWMLSLTTAQISFSNCERKWMFYFYFKFVMTKLLMFGLKILVARSTRFFDKWRYTAFVIPIYYQTMGSIKASNDGYIILMWQVTSSRKLWLIKNCHITSVSLT